MRSAIQNAWITVVRGEGKHLACRITEASGTTFSVSTQEPLMVGETVRLGSTDRRVIAEVRDCSIGEGVYSVDLESVDDRLGLLRIIALRELFDSVPGAMPLPGRKVNPATLGFAALTVALAVSVILSLSSGLTERASARQPRPAPVPTEITVHDVPDPPPLEQAGRLSLRATGLSWTVACADGKKLFERLLKPGDNVDIPFSETAIIRSGNAGSLEVFLGKHSIGPLGQPGAIRTLQATHENYQYLAASSTSVCDPQ